jgi:CRP/FNR family cyclic AMP-dependent transcriptional regulator
MDERALAGLYGTFLGDLGHAARDELLADAWLAELERGEQLFPDSYGRLHLAFVLTGNIRSYLKGPDGRQLTVGQSRAGSMVGSATPGVAGSAIRIFTEASTHCELIVLNPRTVSSVFERHPEAYTALTIEVVRHLEEVYRAFAASAFGSLRERLVAHLLDVAEADNRGGLIAPVVQQDLADALGTAREVVGRTLRGLKADGLVSVARGGIALKDPAALLAAAGRWRVATPLSALDTSAAGHDTLDDAPQPVIAIDARGDIIYANESVERTFGWQPRALIGKSITNLLPTPVIASFLERFDSFMDRVSPGPIGLGADFHGRRIDGTEFPAEVTIFPVRGPAGVAVFASIVDVGYRQALRDFFRPRSGVPDPKDVLAST